jgi:hypothetical protein
MGKSTISMAIFNSFLYVYQAGWRAPTLPGHGQVTFTAGSHGIVVIPMWAKKSWQTMVAIARVRKGTEHH